MAEVRFRIIDLSGRGEFFLEHLFDDKLRRNVCYNPLRWADMYRRCSRAPFGGGITQHHLFYESHSTHGAGTGFVAAY